MTCHQRLARALLAAAGAHEASLDPNGRAVTGLGGYGASDHGPLHRTSIEEAADGELAEPVRLLLESSWTEALAWARSTLTTIGESK